jgi:hypothetical protein
MGRRYRASQRKSIVAAVSEITINQYSQNLDDIAKVWLSKEYWKKVDPNMPLMTR